MPQNSDIQLSSLDGAKTATRFTLHDDTAGVTEARFYLKTSGSVFLARVRSAPFQTVVIAPPGRNTIEVRHLIGGVQSRVKASFVATGPRISPTSSATPKPQDSTPNSAPATVAPTTPPNGPLKRNRGSGGSVTVSNAAQLKAALAAAKPGGTIHLNDGEYQNEKGDRWTIDVSGTRSQPITLEGSRNAILQSDSPQGDYGLWITGSYWRVTGISVRNATKGIVLDGSQDTVLSDVEVSNVGEEGVHFRDCSSNDVLENSFVHDTGLQKPQFGEGVYVGSANSNWSKYSCADGRDNSEHNTIRHNRFQHIAAEGADLKEGTDSGTLTGNSFIDTGYSGANSADSAVDAKGNNWQITNNTASDPQGKAEDAFQSHQVYSGYGTGNEFSGNTAQGRWPGFGFGLNPLAGNVVRCDNKAPDAAKGLVGDNGKSASCQS